MEYLYSDPSGYCFMNCDTYDQVFLEEALLKDVIKYLLPNTRVQVEFYEEKPLGVALPETVDLEVTDTDPPFKGATAAGGGKPATTEPDSWSRPQFHRNRREGSGIDIFWRISGACEEVVCYSPAASFSHIRIGNFPLLSVKLFFLFR